MLLAATGMRAIFGVQNSALLLNMPQMEEQGQIHKER